MATPVVIFNTDFDGELCPLWKRTNLERVACHLTTFDFDAFAFSCRAFGLGLGFPALPFVVCFPAGIWGTIEMVSREPSLGQEGPNLGKEGPKDTLEMVSRGPTRAKKVPRID